MALGAFDRSGRRRPIPQEGSLFTLKADAVIAAIGQTADLGFMDGAKKELAPEGNVIVNADTQETPLAGVFAGGDLVSGPLDIVNAVAAGHRAAEAIDTTLRARKGDAPWKEEFAHFEIPVRIEEDIVERPRERMPMLSPDARSGSFQEVQLGYAERMAMDEATRCLRCDLEID
jgi:NADH-quinone oxidoreductase subunit F